MYPAAICTAASEKIKSAKNGFSKGSGPRLLDIKIFNREVVSSFY